MSTAYLETRTAIVHHLNGAGIHLDSKSPLVDQSIRIASEYQLTPAYFAIEYDKFIYLSNLGGMTANHLAAFEASLATKRRKKYGDPTDLSPCELELATEMNSGILAEDVVQCIAESFLEEDHVVSVEKIPSQFSKIATATRGLDKWKTAHQNCRAICKATKALVEMKNTVYRTLVVFGASTASMCVDAVIASQHNTAAPEKKADDRILSTPSHSSAYGVSEDCQYQPLGLLESPHQCLRALSDRAGSNRDMHRGSARPLPRSRSH